MTIRIEDDVKDRLDRLATSTQRSKSFLAAEAIRAYVDSNAWQVAEVQAALAEADAGDFATADAVAALGLKWDQAAPVNKPRRAGKPKSKPIAKPARQRA
jgi:RHH-type transcriptional regulator, rel operon repressor / antitoxin RelB